MISIILKLASARSTRTRSSGVRPQITWPSTTTDVDSFGSRNTNSNTRSATSTTGRTVSVCGLMGEITNACRFFLKIGPPALNLDLRYLFVDTETGAGDFEAREEVDIEIRSRLNENWSIFGSHRRDLEENDALRTAIGLTYQDECFLIEAVGQRRFFRDREVEPDDSIFFRVVLKHLGGFGIEQ